MCKADLNLQEHKSRSHTFGMAQQQTRVIDAVNKLITQQLGTSQSNNATVAVCGWLWYSELSYAHVGPVILHSGNPRSPRTAPIHHLHFSHFYRMNLLTIVFLPHLVKVTVAGRMLIRMFQWSRWRRVSHPVHVVLLLRPMSTTEDTIQIVPKFVSTGWTVTEDMTFIVAAVTIDNEE